MTEPLIIAHRGAPGYRPEHTLASYDLAIRMGADYIEPDLVSTADDVLVARHENEISGTTDVAERSEFADRRGTKTIDGRELTGWFTENFTLEELKTLWATERIPAIRPSNTRYDGRFPIMTLDEIIDLTEHWHGVDGRRIGIYPETKHPSYFDAIGHNLDDLLLEVLGRRGLDSAEAPVFIQSMEPKNLRALRGRTGVRLIQLLSSRGRPYDFAAASDPRTYADLATAEGLRDIAAYAEGVGVHKDLVIGRDADGGLASETTLVSDAHASGLAVHIWTMRDENEFLPTDLRTGDHPATKGDALGEYERFFDAGVDGMFSDHTDTAVEARRVWQTR